MSTSKQANFDFSIDFASRAKEKVEDKARKKQKSYALNRTRIKENRHIYHKNLYDPALRKVKSEKFREKVRERKKNKLPKTKSNKKQTLVKVNDDSCGAKNKNIQSCENKSECTESSCKAGKISLQGQLKTVKNAFPPVLLKDFAFLASSDSEDEILSLFKLFDSTVGNSKITLS